MQAMQGPQGYGPVMVLNSKTQRQTGRSAQLSNISAARAVADIIRTTLGPRSMLKMLLDPMGGIVITNDGNCILREVDVSHPTAKSMIELSRAQDEEVGDGTTSVIILAGEVLILSESLLTMDHLHPTVIVQGYTRALQVALDICNAMAKTVNVLEDKEEMKKLVQSSIGTKFSSRWNDQMVDMALQAVLTVARSKDTGRMTTTTMTTSTTSTTSSTTTTATTATATSIATNTPGTTGSSDGDTTNTTTSTTPTTTTNTNTTPTTTTTTATPSTTNPSTTYNNNTNYNIDNQMEVDIKRYAKVEKIPGGEISDSKVMRGVMFNKDTTHSKMRRHIINPRILLLDCPLEYKKGESQTNVEITNSEDWNTMLRMEEEYVENMCMEIIAFQPDIVITEKGVSDLAQHYLAKANITAFRRLRKTDNNRVARATGATIVSRTDEIQESDIGLGCGVFEMKKIGDEWFCFLDECKDPKACTIILRGGSKDVLNEIERNLHDAMEVVRNVVYNPKLLPGGGATEMAVAMGIRRLGQKVTGVQQRPFLTVGEAMEVIPRTLAQNCGVSVIRTVTQLRAKHAEVYDRAIEMKRKKNVEVTTTVHGGDVTMTNQESTTTSATSTPGTTTTATTTMSTTSDNIVEVESMIQPCYWGINGNTGKLVDMEELGIWEPFSVKVQTIKTAIESACMILRIDDIVSGSKKTTK